MSALDDLFTFEEEPPLDEPVLVLGLEGWIDAGLGAQTAVEHLRSVSDLVRIGQFDADSLLDFRSRRPEMRLVEGVVRSLRFPAIELFASTDAVGNDFLLLTGAEPDHQWRSFRSATTELATALGVRLVVGLGAYPAPLPHTRPSRLAATATTEALAHRTGWVQGTLDVPAGVQAVIEDGAKSADIPALGIWAQVPHYAAAMPYPPAALRLIEGLGEVAGLAFDVSALRAATRATVERLDELVANSDEHQELVTQLEAYVDQENEEADLPSGDELAAQIQQFLHEQHPDDGPFGPSGDA